MPALDTRASDEATRRKRARSPRVLVVLVVKDGARWLRQCLLSLSRQTHPRIGVLAVDNGSTDGSADIAASALGADRVIRLDRNVGFPAAVARAASTDAARDADYLLLLHDDATLAPDAIARLVEAAGQLDDCGVVGPKVLDAGESRVLREVGQSTDRFGYPYSPLEEGEIDQGQYDRVREVLFVSSCAMLVSRKAWDRVGALDERLDARHDDLDFCWRARLAGFRVLMTPRAVARHLGARAARGGADATGVPRDRYHRERAALASMLKNYGLLTLAWVLPLYVVQGVARMLVLALSRRFEDAYQILAAWGWNAANLPGTLRRRVRAQAVRTVGDRQVRRYMAPAGMRLRRWAMAAAQLLLPSRDVEDQPSSRTLRGRALRFAAAHPAVVAWTGAAVVAVIAYRRLLPASPLAGEALTAFPDGPSRFFREFVSGLRTTGLGGSEPASPALGLLGLGSVLAFGSPALLQKLLLLGLPGVAAVGAYRSVRGATGRGMPAVVAGACYGLSAVVLWAVSEGRIPALVFLAGLPWLARKLPEGFDERLGVASVRWMVGAALGLAVLASFYPGALLAAALLGVAALAVPETPALRGRGATLVVGAALLAAVLTFPRTWSLLRSGGEALADPAGVPSFAGLVRLSPGPGPGDWVLALFLPVAAIVGVVFVGDRFVRSAARHLLLAVAATYLAWLAAAGRLPEGLSNPVAFLGVAALAETTLVGLALASVVGGVRQSAFGHRQLGGAVLAVVLTVGLGGQALAAMRGGWEVGGAERARPAYLAVADSPGRPFRVLWIGRPGGDGFTAPGGPPDGIAEAGRGSVRYAVTGQEGASALDVGRPALGPGYVRLRSVLADVLGGETRHAGALLAPFGIRFVVAADGDLPTAARRRLRGQLDLDLVPSEGLTIYRNPKSLPLAATVADPSWTGAAFDPSSSPAPDLPAPGADRLRGSGQRYRGGPAAPGSLVSVSEQFDPAWELRAGRGEASPAGAAFGWAVGFSAPPSGGGFTVRFGGQGIRTFQVAVLAAFWLAGLWITRRPVRSG